MKNEPFAAKIAVMDKLAHTRGGMAEHVVAYLSERIIAGGLPPEAHLVETAIAAELGISKTPVREALRRLQETGLVEIFPYRGAFVRRITPRFVKEVISLRTNLEVFAVQLALNSFTSKDFETLENYAQQMDMFAQAGDQLAALRLDVGFHMLFYQRADHLLLLENWQMLLPRIELLQAYGRLNASPMVKGQVEERHLALVAALRTGDPDAASRAVRKHIELGPHMIFGNEFIVRLENDPT